MEIYSFINSKDIAEHCRTIGHEFTPLEMAFIVYLSDKTLSERHRAWQWIIDTLPDMEVPERRNMNHFDSLHQFLCDYMALENRILDIFQTDESNAVYTCECLYSSFNGGADAWDTLSPTYSAVWENIKNNTKDADIVKYRIDKHWIGEGLKSIEAIFNPDGELKRIREYCVLDDEHSKELCIYGFDGFWIEVPTPFQKGDIVNNPRHNNTPIVLTDICCWPDWRAEEHLERLKKDWDTTDLTYSGYSITESGHICNSDGSHYYLDIEYFRGVLQNENRVLLALSNYIKENRDISEDLLLNAYEIILKDEYISKNYLSEYYLEAAGLKESRADISEPPKPT